jgi:phage FluMu gp28-like protein
MVTAWARLQPKQWKPILYDLMDFRPHDAQAEILYNPARFRIVACGRRFGKTTAASAEAVAYALLGGHVWIVAPTYDLTRPLTYGVESMLRNLCRKSFLRDENLIKRRRTVPYELEFVTGGIIQTRTAENPRSLQGRAIDLLVIDEAATIRDGFVWSQYLRPTLTDREGHALIISTPKRMNWFWDLFIAGQDPNHPQFVSFQMPTFRNPYIPREEVEQMLAELDEDTARQEIYAEFLPEGGSVFRHIHKCLQAEWQYAPIAGHQYTVGVDLAKYRDFTVIAVIDATIKQLCYMERFNLIDWNTQAERIMHVARRFHAPICIDATGNDHMADTLMRNGLQVYPYVFTPMSKLTLISKLAMGLEYDGLQLLNDPILIDEFARFEYERTEAGRLRVKAPEGKHDDIVIAVALAWEIAIPYTRSVGYLPMVDERWTRGTTV